MSIIEALNAARPFVQHARDTAVSSDYREECQHRLDLIDRALAEIPFTHRHVKRGSIYRIIATPEAQVSTGAVEILDVGPKFLRRRYKRPIQDGDRLIVYENADGKQFARFADEFNDGRFVLIEKEAKS